MPGHYVHYLPYRNSWKHHHCNLPPHWVNKTETKYILLQNRHLLATPSFLQLQYFSFTDLIANIGPSRTPNVNFICYFLPHHLWLPHLIHFHTSCTLARVLNRNRMNSRYILVQRNRNIESDGYSQPSNFTEKIIHYIMSLLLRRFSYSEQTPPWDTHIPCYSAWVLLTPLPIPASC